MRLLSVAFSVVLLIFSGNFVHCHAQVDGGTLTISGGGGVITTGATTTALTTGGLTFIGGSGSLTLTSAANASIASGLNQLTINNGMITGTATSNVTGGSLVLSSGAAFNNAGTLTLTNAATLSAGTITSGLVYLNSANLTLNAASINTLSRSLVLNGSSPLIFAGTNTAIDLSGGSTLTVNGTTTILNSTSVLNTAGGVLTLNGTAPALVLASNNPIIIPSTGTLTINSGILTASGGALTITGTAPSILLTNGLITSSAGTLTLNGGTLIPSGGVLNLTGSTNITLTPGATAINTTALGLPVSTTLTINVAAGSSFGTLPSVGSINLAGGSVASFLGGVNTNGGSVSLLYLPAVQNLVSNPLQLHVSEFDNGTHGKYVLEMSYNPATAAAIGDAIDNYLAWFDPSDGTWKNAVFGNSDGGASAHFVNGAYDPTTDFHLGWYGIDPTTDEVWAVVDHNSTFGVANEDVAPTGAPDVLSPTGVPEPSTLALLVSGLALLGRRRRKA